MPHDVRIPELLGLDVLGWATRRFLAVLIAVTVLTPIGLRDARALPSFARQTGQECAACHNGFPNRDFMAACSR